MDPRLRQIPADVRSLDSMSSKLREGETPAQRQIEETLERGFAKLMQLEAELQKQQSAGAAESDIQDLEEAIATLREALTMLRTLSSPPGPARVGYGFVLPRRSAPGRVHRRR